MPDYKTPEYVWLGVVSLFQFAQKYTAALKAYGETCGDSGSENAFIEISQEALWRQLMSELSKIYDREQTCGADNLSINQLRSLCMKHQNFLGGEDNEIIMQLKNLQARYEALLSKNLRNKKLAHYDLSSAFTQEAPAIPFSQIEEFVTDTSVALTSAGERLLGGELSPEYEELVHRYRDALLVLVQKK